MFLTLSEYLLGARKLLALYGYNIHKNDEDAISFVASCMMKADQTWDGVSSSRDTWRFNQARYAILKLKAQYRKRKNIVSLSKVVGEKGEKKILLSDVLQDKSPQTYTHAYDEVLKIAKHHLTQKQYQCISLYYSEQKTMEDIGSQLGITKQAVSLHIKNAIRKLTHECRNKIDYIAT